MGPDVKTNFLNLARAARDWVAARGLVVRTVRGREHWRAGIEAIWHEFDSRTERVFISQVERFGVRPLFLVRHKEDWIQGHHFRGVFYSVEELSLISDYFTPGTFLDVGANVGNHSVFAATALGADRVIACEPNPTASAILLCNIALNHLGKVIEHVPFALSDRQGTALAVEKELNLGATQVMEGPGSLELRRGDDMFSHENITFVKIDVEGAELAVLEGLKETINRCRPNMLVEVDDRSRDGFEAFCRDARYKVAASLQAYAGQSNLIVVPL